VSVFIVPPLDEREDELWPTLGEAVWEWQLENLVYGPGDLKGVSLQDHPPDEEYRAVLRRAYQIYPRGHALEGRRRFKRVALSVRKGTAKTEKAAWIVAGELHPEAPVRFDGWDAYGRPVGRGVADPYVPMVAFTEEQSEELAYGALKVILEESDLAEDFDIGWERILVLDSRGRPAGKAVALASAPNSRDGARTTFQHFDESHRMVLDRLKASFQTMQANLPKRKAADAWSLETTTTYAPGELSVAEGTHEYAEMIAAGDIEDPRLFYFHRQAGDHHKIRFPDGHAKAGKLDREAMLAAVAEASGPAAEWSDLDSIVALGLDPQTDVAYWERVWLNRPVQSSSQAFSVERWDELAAAEKLWRPEPKKLIVLGFDGSRVNDATALVGTDVATGRQFVLGFWERPILPNGKPKPGWAVPEDEVHAAVEEAFTRWRVWRMYADPPYWEVEVATWEGRFRRKGKPLVFEWWTNRNRPMAYSLRAYKAAMEEGLELSHDGHEGMRRHVGNARRHELTPTDEEGAPLWTIRKERQESPKKIDAVMAGCLSWEAYRDAVAAGMKRVRSRVPRTF
jgi:hypothetical protein